MAGNKTHDYHILEPDIWPLIGSISALTFTIALLFVSKILVGSGF